MNPDNTRFFVNDLDRQRLLILIDRYLNGEATPAEILEVDDWYRSFDTAEGLPPETLEPGQFQLEKTILQKRDS